MHAAFPFGYPWPTAFYLSLYVLTLVGHVVCMNYVLAGSAYLAVVRWRKGTAAGDDPAAALLADWLPLMLSLAITAGIAPLLFVQILYRPQFYTANLLLFHRWMAILPVLIVGFYLLYLIRKPALRARFPRLERLATVAVFGCFAFIGWSWTENHLLSLQSQAVWTAEYARSGWWYFPPELLPRLAAWLCGSFPALAVWLLWQLRWTGPPIGPGAAAQLLPTQRRLARMAQVALGLALLSGFLYSRWMPVEDRAVLASPLTRPWLGAALAGAAMQAISYWQMLSRGEFQGGWLKFATAGVLLTTLGVAVVREMLRLARVDLSSLLPQHEAAFAVGGLGVFVFFLVLNSALIVWCIRLTKRPA